MQTLVIIPAFNEAGTIRDVIAGIRSAGNWDILAVDDGSSDGTATEALSAGAKVLRHKLNRGQGAALKTGIEFASRADYEAAVFFDADGQMDASEIGLLLDKLKDNFDVALGSRNLGRSIDMPLHIRLMKKAALIFTRLTTGLDITDTHIGFQAWRVSALRKINLDQDRMAHASQLLSEISRLKLKYAEVPVTIRYTDYSLNKGQGIAGVFNVLWDLLIK